MCEENVKNFDVVLAGKYQNSEEVLCCVYIIYNERKNYKIISKKVLTIGRQSGNIIKLSRTGRNKPADAAKNKREKLLKKV